MAIAGALGVVRVLFLTNPDNIEFLNISLTLMLLGTLMAGLGVLAGRPLAMDEAYNLGRDVGVEEGFQEGRKVARPVVVELTYPKDEVQIRRHPE